MIKFSIIVPVYNVEQYVAECIESVLNQTYSNYELILVDDGTPDKSGDICDRYSKMDSRIIVYHKTNKGLIHTRRYGIEKASGDYYVFLDSDDRLKINALEVIAKTIDKYGCDTVIYGLERVKENKVISQTFEPEEIYLDNKLDIYNKVFFENDMNALWRKAVSSHAFKGIDYSPYYHIQIGEDLLQSLEIYKNSRSIAFINDILYQYRMNPQSMMHNKVIKNIDFTVRKKALDFLQSENVFTQDDFDRYRDFCIGLLIQELFVIGTMDTSIGKKKKLLLQIRNDNYYKSFLNRGLSNRSSIGSKAIIYDLFQKKQDTFLLIIINIWEKKTRVFRYNRIS